MSFEINNIHISKHKGKDMYLLDSSVFVKSEEMSLSCSIDFIDTLSSLSRECFFISNEVLVELMNGPRQVNIGYFQNHILNVEGSMDHSLKENRFIIEENGQLKVIKLNKVSIVDYNQIHLCQNHTELILISNDRKQLKSAAQVIPGRVLGLPVLVNKLATKYPANKRISELNNFSKKVYEIKNALNKSDTK